MKYRKSIEYLSYGPSSVKTEGKLETLTVNYQPLLFSFFSFLDHCGVVARGGGGQPISAALQACGWW